MESNIHTALRVLISTSQAGESLQHLSSTDRSIHHVVHILHSLVENDRNYVSVISELIGTNIIDVSMKPLDNKAVETWSVDADVSRQVVDGIHCKRFDDFLLVSAECSPFDAAETQTQDLYRRLLAVAGNQGFKELIRIWNYMPDINAGEGDEEVYRQFCIGREQAFQKQGIQDNAYCSASALGHFSNKLVVYMLLSKHKGQHFENPHQQSAYRYPKQYGQKSPSFARATLSREAGCLFISGTSSITGHKTLYAGDLHSQLQLTIDNITALIEDISRRANTAFSPLFYKVYVRHEADGDAVKKYLAHFVHETPCIYVQADICRSDLLIEIEAVMSVVG